MMLADLDTTAATMVAWLLTYAIHSTILLGVAAIAAWRLADYHAWLDLIWKTAVIAPLVTASVNLDALPTPLTIPMALTSLAPMKGSPYEPVAVPSVPPVAAPEPPITTGVARPETEPLQTSYDTSRATEKRQAIAAAGTRLPAWPWPLIAATAWLFVATIAVLRYGVRLRRVYDALGSGPPVTTEVRETIDGLRESANERRSIRVTTSAHCPVPLALGGRHIVVPERFFQELDAEQQRAALAHEVAHVVRRDPEWRIALEMLERALFFQPLNRLARARLCDAAEFLCDEWAVQQTQSPLALARCLSVIGSWWSPADEMPAGVSAMARSDSAMVRRVTRILNEPQGVSRGPRLPWLVIAVALIAIAAPRVTAMQVPSPAPVVSTAAAVLATAETEMPAEQRAQQRDWSPSEVAAVRSRVRDYRSAGGQLEQRWRQALADAGKQNLTDFWVVYTFTTPIHADGLVFSDSRDGISFTANGNLHTAGPPLVALLNMPAIPLEGGRVAVATHHRSARADAIDRVAHLSVQLGLDFGRAQVFWLGDAPGSESFAHVQSLFGQVGAEKMQVALIEVASLHPDANLVTPFLARLVERPWSAEIRREAAEGFEHQHDPRSVETLLRVARTDPDSSVRTEAAEAIGEVQTPQSIPALSDLVRNSDDPEVRREAAEAFANQPAEQALPAIQSALASNTDDDVLGELVEALGDLEGASVLSLLVETVNRHPNRMAQKEAVETIGDIDEPGAIEALARIASGHPDPEIRHEAIDTLGDRKEDAEAVAAIERILRDHPSEETQVEAIDTLAEMAEGSIPAQIVALAESSGSARIRRAAIEAIADALDKVNDSRALDTAEQMLERVIYNDPDTSVRMEALDALDELPADRADRALRKIADGHPDPRVRREAAEHLRKD